MVEKWLDKHPFQAGGFNLFKLFKLDGVLGNQRVQRAEVGADFFLFFRVGKKEPHDFE